MRRAALALAGGLASLGVVLAAAPARAASCRWSGGAVAYVLPLEPDADYGAAALRVGCSDGTRGYRGTFGVAGLGEHRDQLVSLGFFTVGAELDRLVAPRVSVGGALDAGVQFLGRGGVIVDDPSVGADEGELLVSPSGHVRLILGPVLLELGVGLRLAFGGDDVHVGPDLTAGVSYRF